MKYKRERRSKTKSKSSKLDRRKLKKFLKQQGISSLEAMVMLDSSLTSRGMNDFRCFTLLWNSFHIKFQPMEENIARVDDPNRQNIARIHPVRVKVMVRSLEIACFSKVTTFFSFLSFSDRQSNGRKHTKSRTDRKKRKKSSGKCRESSSHHPHTSKMYNGHRKHSSQSSSSSSPSPSKKNTSDGKRIVV